jgi:hypothetical protein
MRAVTPTIIAADAMMMIMTTMKLTHTQAQQEDQ